jgi:hypothetical protein
VGREVFERVLRRALARRVGPCCLCRHGDDDIGRLDPEHQQGLAADISATYSDDLVPVANSGRPHRDHELVRSERLRHRQLEHLPPNVSMPAARISRPFSAASSSWLLMLSRLRVAA